MIYLDNAATSFPKPPQVYSRIDYILRNISGSPARASHRMALEAGRVVFRAREALSKLIGAPDSSRVVFTKNATESINVALKGMLRPGGHAVTSSIEHNSVAKTLYALEKEGVEVTRVAPDSLGFLDLATIAGAIKDNTRILCIAHASNVFGAIQDVTEIGRLCRKKGVLFMVDAAQTAGALPIDVIGSNIDILAGTGHKALFGPQGTGFLYLRDGIEPDQLISGGTGEMEALLEIPERLEAGTMNMPGIGGLSEGVEFVLSEGVGRIRAHEVALVSELVSGVGSIPGAKIIGPLEASKRASLLAFTLESVSVAGAGMRLDEEFSILTRCGAHCAPDAHRHSGTHQGGAIRVSPGYFNTRQDIEKFLEAIKKIAVR